MARLKTFVRGSSTYHCRVCERLTRATSREELGLDGICKHCYELAGIENTISDNGIERAAEWGYVTEAHRLLAELATKPGADMTNWDDLKAVLADLPEPARVMAASRYL